MNDSQNKRKMFSNSVINRYNNNSNKTAKKKPNIFDKRRSHDLMSNTNLLTYASRQTLNQDIKNNSFAPNNYFKESPAISKSYNSSYLKTF